MTNNLEIARTGAFVTLVITQLIHVLECKSESKSLFEIDLLSNKFLIFATLTSLIMILVVVYIAKLQIIFRTTSLMLNEWLIILGFSFLGPGLVSFLKQFKK